MMPSAVSDLEIELLEDLIIRGWHYLFRFQTCLVEEKQELDGFLEEYYAQLGGWLQQAAQAAGTGEGGETTTARVNHLHSHHKFLYRDALKMCHPDVSSHPQATQWVREICQAYAEGNSRRLVILRRNIQRETFSTQEYLQHLRAEYLQLQSKVNHAREGVHKLRHSPAYRLQQRIAHAKQRGYDLLGVIVQHLQGANFAPAV